MTKTSLTNRAYPEGDEEASEFSGWTPRDINRLRHYVSSSDGEGVVSPMVHQTEIFIKKYD